MSKDAAEQHKHVAVPNWSAIALGVVSLSFILLGHGCGRNVGTPSAFALFPQTQLNGTCIPRFAISLPVFGPAGSIPRVDAASHPNLTVTMAETAQQVLPQGSYGTCGAGVTLRETRVWTYQTTDSSTGAVLGPAHWPAVTIVASRGTATQVEYVNELPSFNPASPTGPGLVQGVLPFDQTVHWADPLQSGCAMQMQNSQALPAVQGVRSRPTDGSSGQRSASLLTPRFAASTWQIQQASFRMPASMQSMPSSIESSAASTTGYTSPCLQKYIGPVPATVHLHGAEIAAAYDGDPESWFTPNGLKGPDYHTLGAPQPGRAIYQYPNSQEPGTLWFHDHALGVTRLNVYAGLAGFYFLQDPDREPQGYPSGPYEIELAVQDRMFDTNSQLYFPQQQQSHNHPFWSPAFEGDVAAVNGAAFPYLIVEPRRYRFHILNGSENRGYTLVFGDAPVYLIGSDDNYFDRPVPLPLSASGVSEGLPVSPGERADIIVDFSRFAGQNIEVTNTRRGQYVQLPEIMQFRVAATASSPDTSCDPTNPDMSTGVCARKYPLVRLTDGNGNVLPGVKVDRVRQMILYDYVERSTGPVPTDIKEFVNNTTWNGLESPSIARDFPSDGISELPRVGSIELWEIVYLSTMPMASHPVHLHLSQFQVLNRQQINIENPDTHTGYLTEWLAAFGQNPSVPLPTTCVRGHYCLNYGPPLDYSTPNKDGALGGNPAFGDYLVSGTVTKPEPGESGWKDTADAKGEQVLRILVRWTPSDVPITPNQSYAGQTFYGFDPTQDYYVWHCHVITHEDNEMMRPYRVTR